jgi:copper(I)-binding protein
MIPLLNEAARADRLVLASTPLAATVSVWRGEAPASDLVLAPGRPVAMRPDGLHLHVAGLTRPLVHGDKVPMRLVFAQAGEADIEVWIEPRPYAGPPPSR